MWSRRSRLFRFVFERQLELGPVDQLPTVTDDDVVLGHLSHSDVTDRSPRRGDGLCRCFLPGGRTRSNHIDYPVHAHDDLSFASMEPSIMVAPYGSVDGCPLLPVLGRKQTPGVHDHAVEDRPDEPSLGGRGWCRCRRSTPSVRSGRPPSPVGRGRVAAATEQPLTSTACVLSVTRAHF